MIKPPATELTIIDCLITHTHTSPGSTAFIFLEDGDTESNRLTYATLLADVKALAAGLSGKLSAGQRALLIFQDMQSFITAFLACQYAGIVAIPVPFIKGKRQFGRLENIMEDAGAAALLCNAAAADTLTAGLQDFPAVAGIPLITTDTANATIAADLPPVYQPLAFIQYTSGSTGRPKGVMISHQNLLHNQEMIKDAFGCDTQSVIFTWLPFHHDMGLIGNLLHTVYTGCTGVIMSPFHFMQSPVKWLKGITRYKATHSGGPNFAFDTCVDKIPAAMLAELDLSSWKLAFNGSEQVRHETLQRFAKHFSAAGFRETAFHPCYGLAEATLIVSGKKQRPLPLTLHVDREALGAGKLERAAPGAPQTRAMVSAGVPAPGITVKIITTAGAETDLTGEICVAGDSITSGYWQRPQESLFYEIDGRRFLRTGDLGFLYEGEIFVHGRLKEMIIVRGQNYYPTDIETIAAGSHPAIAANSVAAFTLSDTAEAAVIVAEIRRDALQQLSAAEVIRAVDTIVQGTFGIPLYDIVLTTPLGIPRTTSGKLQRVQCRTMYAQQQFSVLASRLGSLPADIRTDNGEDITIPTATAGTEAVRDYLLQLIARKTGAGLTMMPDADADLAALGIDSLRGMELINTINKDLQINLDAGKVFQVNTLAGLTDTIENMLWLKNAPASGKEITI